MGRALVSRVQDCIYVYILLMDNSGYLFQFFQSACSKRHTSKYELPYYREQEAQN